jgi:hypothetical protein
MTPDSTPADPTAAAAPSPPLQGPAASAEGSACEDARAGRDDRHAMRDEARAVVDAARAEGLTVRLLGGLGVREHCRDLELCARDYSDIDLVARAAESRRLAALLARFGYREDYAVAGATGNGQLQFVRPCRHDAQRRPSHDDDHIDVFLDTFRMDHTLALRDRLDLDPYTLAPADLLLTKLQVFRLTEKDARDIVTLLDAFDVDTPAEASAAAGRDRASDAPRDRDPRPTTGVGVRPTIDATVIAGRCAADWGLFHDVATNLQRVGELLPGFALDDARQTHVRRGLARLTGALDDAPKSLRFRARARVGTRVAWHSEVDDQD